MDKRELRVAVIGDSAMWGQGLKDEDKFAFKSAQRIAALLGREANIVVNSARSGASIRAGSTEAESRKKREAFIDTYPEFFVSETSKEEFLGDNNQPNQPNQPNQAIAFRLHPEIPSTFPTISFQVQFVTEAIGRSIDLVFINGGTNDLDFQEFFKVDEHRDDFVEFFDPQIEEYFSLRTRSLLRQARGKFPNAVLVLTGYWSPFAEGVSNDEIRELFIHEEGAERWEVVFNDNLIHLVPIDALVREAQVRSQYGLARGLYWARRVVAEANEDPSFRGPGILFAHPQFGPENSVFAPNSFCHREYELDQVTDAVKKIREDNCPRFPLKDGYATGIKDFLSPAPNLKPFAEEVLSTFEGPTSLLNLCRDVISNTTLPDLGTERAIVKVCESELKRINNSLRASFLHPNEKGAERYAGVIVKRFDERHSRIRLRGDLMRLAKPGVSTSTPMLSLKASLRRYGLGSQTSLRAITQLMPVDSVRLEIVTSMDSEVRMADDIFVNLGAGHRWRLNFPIGRQAILVNPPALRKIAFRPGSRDVFTIDARAAHLGSFTELTLERTASPVLSNEPDLDNQGGFDKRVWKPASIKLQINGKEVFSSSISTTLPRDGKLTFPYPA